MRIEHLSVDGARDFSIWVTNVLRLTTERSEVGQVFRILYTLAISVEERYQRAYLDTGQDREQHWQS